jgi:hypothetical protein
MNQTTPAVGQWYLASDGRYYRWPDPTPYASIPQAAQAAPSPWSSPPGPDFRPARRPRSTRGDATLLLVGSGLVTVGSLLPWVSATILFANVSPSGVAIRAGLVTLVLGFVSAVIGLCAVAESDVPRWLLWLTLPCGIVSAAVAGLVAAGAAAASLDEEYGWVQPRPAFGVFVVLAGAVLVIVVGPRLAVAQRFAGCARCSENVPPYDLPRHLTYRHGLPPQYAVAEARQTHA